MIVTRTPTRTALVGTMAALCVFALAGCCKKGSETDADAALSAVPPPPSAPPSEAPPVVPPWKQKCPEAEQAESGTITAARSIQVYKGPTTTSEKAATVAKDTIVSLLGSREGWWCIDYPCGAGMLCAGWVEERNTAKAKPRDAGADGAISDAAAKDAASDAAPALLFADAGDGGKVIVNTEAIRRLLKGKLGGDKK